MIRKGDTFITTSRDVADYFGKDHHNILKQIDGLLAEPDAATIAVNFHAIEIAIKVGFGTRLDRAYEMTRDGFTEASSNFGLYPCKVRRLAPTTPPDVFWQKSESQNKIYGSAQDPRCPPSSAPMAGPLPFPSTARGFIMSRPSATGERGCRWSVLMDEGVSCPAPLSHRPCQCESVPITHPTVPHEWVLTF
ncbi:Rha family transcriptional regulator [Loktanella sp. SALINAS62]|nr:Rha family transcriptional regulator [Loktanella sp. SALINAS62]